MTDLAERALAYHEQHFNCSQSVLAAFAPQFGLPEATALKLASPLGGGIARQGHVCGAVTGALLALGLARGADTPAGKDMAYRMGQEFLRHFQERHSSLQCRELLGFDIRTPQEWQQANAAGVFQSVCPVLIREAVEIARAMLEA
jgi:C_GCAxxG_C_C family probable redox protein